MHEDQPSSLEPTPPIVPDDPDRPVTILVSAVSAVLGGGITVAQSLTRSMATGRPDCRFLLYCSHPEVAEFAYPENVTVHFRPELASRRVRWVWEQRTLPAEAVSEGVDVILALGGYASFRTRIPQVCVWQNSNVFSPPGIPRPLSEAILIRVQRFVQKHSMRVAAQNVFLTQNSVELASRWWDMTRYRHCVILSGIEVDRNDEALPLEQRSPSLLSVGHTYSHKNYETLIEAMKVYQERYGDPPPLEIVGAAANADYFEALGRQIRDAKLEDVVKMSGGSPAEIVRSKMARARVYVVTSLLETFGLTLLEAMAQGVPVIASDATCHPEVCGDAALYCDPHDAGDIADQVHRLLADDELAEEMRAKGFERIDAFSWDDTARRYLDELTEASSVTES